jgi:hypothetical protein
MAKQTWEIQMNQGRFMPWCVTSQAENKVTVTLQDGVATYFSASVIGWKSKRWFF